MAVLKGADLLHATKGFLEGFDLREDFVTLVSGGFGLGVGEFAELDVDGFSFGHGVEEACKEGAFLGSDLSGGGVVCDGAVADSPDVFGAVDNEVFIHGQTAAGVFLSRNLGHEVLDDGAEGISGGPDEKAVGEGFGFFGAVGAGVFGLDGFIGDCLDHSFGADGDGFFFEGGFRVVD